MNSERKSKMTNNNPWNTFNLSTVFNDPRLCNTYEYTRNIGKKSMETGYWEGTESKGTFKGIIQSATEADVEMLPQGTKINDMISITSDSELYLAEKDHLADVVSYRGRNYQIISERIYNWNLFSYIAQRLGCMRVTE